MRANFGGDVAFGQAELDTRADRAGGDPFRPTLLGLHPFDHGPAPEQVRARSARGLVHDLSSNESAFGPSPRVLDALTGALPEAWRYPDPRSLALRGAIAARLGICPQRLIFGTGSEALIEFIIRATVGPGDAVLICPPTFPIYANYARALGGEVISTKRNDSYRIDPRDLAMMLEPSVRALFLCNPNNPTGTPIETGELEQIARLLGPRCLLVVDEAYHEFADIEHPGATIAALERTDAHYVVLRTFSKAFALGGYRVGYGITSDPEVVEKIALVRTQFPLPSISQTAALAAWQDFEYTARAVRETRVRRERLRATLTDLGWCAQPSAANFLFVPCSRRLDELEQHLLNAGIIVRRVGQLGVRITVGSPEANSALVSAAKDFPC